MDNLVDELVASHLKQPYARLIIPETDGTFRGEILEFPGCITTGDTPDEALNALEDAAKNWLEAALVRGQSIPNPVDASEFSGRLVLRLPRSLHKRAARLAEREGVSLNQFISVSLAECVGERSKSLNTVIVHTMSSVNSGAYQTLQGIAGLKSDTTTQIINGLFTSIAPVTLMPVTAPNPRLQTG